MAIIYAPFTNEQVLKLIAWQEGCVHFTINVGDKIINVPPHPLRCSHDGCERLEQPNEGALMIPTNEGWVCPCGKWKQDWCHDFMVETPRTETAPTPAPEPLLLKQTI